MKRILLLSIMFVECSSPIPNYPVNTISEKNTKILDTFSLIPNLVKDWQFLALEMTESSVIETLTDIKFDDNNIFILSQNTKQNRSKILVFNKQGKFLNSIGSIGRGPEEFSRIDAWNIDVYKKEVAILDCNSFKIKKYNYRGSFIESNSIPPEISTISTFHFTRNGDILLFNCINEKTTDEWILFSPNFNEKNILSKNNIKFKGIAKSIFHPLSYYKDSIILIRNFCDTIYQYKSKQLLPKYYISINKTVPNNYTSKGFMYENMHKYLQNKGYDTRRSIYETDTYLIIEQTKTYIIWNKQQGQGISCKLFNNDNHSIPIPNNFLETHNNIIVGWKSCSSILADEEYCKNKNIQISQQLQKLFNIVKEEDNPVLIYYELKERL